MARGKSVALSNGKSWPTQKAAEDYFRGVLHSYSNGDFIEDREHHEDLVALVERFDEAHVSQGIAPEAGCGIDCFFRKLNTNPLNH